MSSQGVLTRLMMRLVPARFYRQAEEVEEQVAATEEQLKQVEQRGHHVKTLVKALQADRDDNHYASRVKAAYMGRES